MVIMSENERLRKIMTELNISKGNLAKALNISISSTIVYLNGTHKIRKILALAIQAYYGVNANWLLYNKKPMFVEKYSNTISDEALSLAKSYENLPKSSQEVLQKVSQALCTEKKSKSK